MSVIYILLIAFNISIIAYVIAYREKIYYKNIELLKEFNYRSYIHYLILFIFLVILFTVINPVLGFIFVLLSIFNYVIYVNL